MEEVVKTLQAEFDKRTAHLFSFDPRFCGQDLGKTRRVAATDEQVTCKHCLMNMAQAEIDEQGLEHYDPTDGI